MAAPILDRDCACGTKNAGVSNVDIRDADGNVSILSPTAAGRFVINDYGPHPDLQLNLLPAQGTPLEYTKVSEEQINLRWAATQNGRRLIAADGITVIYEAPSETVLAINGATGGPSVFGGIRTTPNGESGHSPSVALELSTANPPPFRLDANNAIELDPTFVDPAIATNAAAIAANTVNITSNDTDIATNVTNIGTNSTDIATNATDIATNTADIATLSAAAPVVFPGATDVEGSNPALYPMGKIAITNGDGEGPANGQGESSMYVRGLNAAGAEAWFPVLLGPEI